MPDNTILFVAIGIAIFIALKFFFARPGIAARDAAHLAEQGTAEIIDVREPPEWRSGVAQPAHLLPMSDFRGARVQWRPFLEENREKRLLVYCASGMRSAHVAAILRKEGFDAVNLGGLGRWQGADLPTRKP